MLAKNKEETLEILTTCGLALLLFFYLTQGKILNISYFGWMESLENLDPTNNLIGWLFFKNTALLQNPLGLNEAYGRTLGGSIVYSDSVPLLAIICKFLFKNSAQNFQYFGWWLLSCFVLQAVFATLLLRRISNDIFFRIFAATFFIFAPILTYRMVMSEYGGHYALCAHWLLLASILLYLRKEFSGILWFVLIAVASGIHFYLCFMVMLFWLTDLVQKFFEKKINLWQIFINLFASFVGLFFVLFEFGYFTVGIQNSGMGGYNVFKMNLLAPFDSNKIWSKIMPDFSQNAGEYEGFNFLGIGVIFLGVIGAISAANHRQKINLQKAVPLTLLSIFLFFFSLSNKISLGAVELTNFELPIIIRELSTIFRASGRIFWPVYYLLIFLALYLVSKNFSKNSAIFLVGFFASLQLFDSFEGFAKSRENFLKTYEKENNHITQNLVSSAWSDYATKYKKITLVPMQYLADGTHQSYMTFAHFAAINKMEINSAFLGRYNAYAMKQANWLLAKEVESGVFDKNSLYIFTSEELWKKATQKNSPKIYAKKIDGFFVIAP
jgi:hypothetical protein